MVRIGCCDLQLQFPGNCVLPADQSWQADRENYCHKMLDWTVRQSEGVLKYCSEQNWSDKPLFGRKHPATQNHSRLPLHPQRSVGCHTYCPWLNLLHYAQVPSVSLHTSSLEVLGKSLEQQASNTNFEKYHLHHCQSSQVCVDVEGLQPRHLCRDKYEYGLVHDGPQPQHLYLREEEVQQPLEYVQPRPKFSLILCYMGNTCISHLALASRMGNSLAENLTVYKQNDDRNMDERPGLVCEAEGKATQIGNTEDDKFQKRVEYQYNNHQYIFHDTGRYHHQGQHHQQVLHHMGGHDVLVDGEHLQRQGDEPVPHHNPCREHWQLQHRGDEQGPHRALCGKLQHHQYRGGNDVHVERGPLQRQGDEPVTHHHLPYCAESPR